MSLFRQLIVIVLIKVSRLFLVLFLQLVNVWRIAIKCRIFAGLECRIFVFLFY
jgi:hypothetical protein